MSRRTVCGIAIWIASCTLLAGAGCGSKTTASPDTDSGTPAGPDAGGQMTARPDASTPSNAQDSGAQPDGQPASMTTPPKPGGDLRLSLLTTKKLDLLFDIDNSASMGDKQEYLAEAVPDLVKRLVTPNCVDTSGNVVGVSDTKGNCAMGAVEFPPVQDMHIGVMTTSLGPRLGNACDPAATQSTPQGNINRHNDDQGHLINRASDPANLTNYTETSLADLGTANFLNWFPQGAVTDGGVAEGGASEGGAGEGGASDGGGGVPSLGAPPIGDPARLTTDFKSLIVGAHSFGCGIESQLESWYRFLIQPDPYLSLATTKVGQSQVATWQGIDTTILAQRAAFLRPDSLVVVIVLSDENDSEVDVRSFGGTAWNFMTSPGFNPPRGTSICATSPGDPTCTSCAFGKNASDSQCQTNNGTYTDPHDWGYDLNLRHVHEQQKYGVSVQFPVQRYVLGLSSPTVPDRSGEYPAGASAYQGLLVSNQNCTNPLFAAQLPTPPADVDASQWQPTADEVCHLPAGSRAPGSVLYMHIGGVPHQLVQSLDPTNVDSPQKPTLSPDDWTLILGNDPLNYDYSGIDPHMVESYQPRTGVAVPLHGSPVAAATAPEGTDPISGREWTTNSTSAEHQGLLVDREYACTFKLTSPRQCDNTATSRDATLLDSCDCEPPTPGTGSFTHDEVPAVCNDTVPTQQDYAKAYPTIRELLLAKLLGEAPGANQGVVSSICPIHSVESAPGDPVYGYRPAMSVLIERLKAP